MAILEYVVCIAKWLIVVIHNSNILKKPRPLWEYKGVYVMR